MSKISRINKLNNVRQCYKCFCVNIYRMPWQGDSTISIDRFDARAHLDYIPEIKSSEEEDK